MTHITTIAVGTRTRAHLTLKRNQHGQLLAQVCSADGILRAEVPVAVENDRLSLGMASRFSKDAKYSGIWARDVIARVLSVKRARAAYTDLGCYA